MNYLPLIHMFSNNKKFYIYDVIKNCILCVDENLYNEILVLKNIGVIKYKKNKKNTENYKTVLDLIDRNYFKSSPVLNIKNENIDDIRELLNYKFNQLILNVSQYCNFKCRYCSFSSNNPSSRNGSSKIMSWNVARKAIDFAINHGSEINKMEIGFYGGEPLSNFNIIKKSINYCENLLTTKKFNYSMTTNLSLLNEEMLKFLVKHNVELLVSLDGPKDIQNKNRLLLMDGRGTFDIVFKNLMLIKEQYPNYLKNNISFNSVIMPGDNISTIASFFKENFPGNKYSLSNVDLSQNIYVYDNDDFFDEKYEEKTKFEKNVFLKFKSNKMFFKRDYPMGQCAPGYTRSFVDIDGNIYPCEKINLNNPSFIIGNIFTDFYYENIKKHMNILENWEKICKNCWAFKLCGICSLFLIDFNGNPNKIGKENFCESIKKALTEILIDYVEGRKK